MENRPPTGMPAPEDAGAPTTATHPGSTATAEHPPAVIEPRRSGAGRRWAIVAAIAVVFILAIGYLLAGVALAAGPVSRAESALKTTVSHDHTIAAVFDNEPLKDVDWNSDNPDFTAIKAAVAKARQDWTRWKGLVQSDRAALRKARGDLTTSILTLPENGTIQNRARRVDAGIAALGTAQQAIALFNRQMAFVDPFIDALAGFGAVGKAGDAKDINGMETALASTSANLQKAIGLTQSASLPPQLTSEMTIMQRLITDLQGLIAAVKAGNSGGVDRYVAAGDADTKALDAVDTTAIEAGLKAMYQPLADAYEREMKLAAGI